MKLTDNRGVDTAIEAVGLPITFEMCEQIIAPGGVIANIGVHGVQVALHLERLWDRNITITTRLVDTASTPMLLKILKANRIDPNRLITHRFKLDHILEAYETFETTREDQGAESEMGKLFQRGARPRCRTERQVSSAYYAMNARALPGAGASCDAAKGDAPYVESSAARAIVCVEPWNFPYYQLARVAAGNLMATATR